MSSFEHLYSQKKDSTPADSRALHSRFERALLAGSVALWGWALASAAELTELTPAWLLEQIRLLIAP